MASHSVPVENAVQQQYGLDQLSNAVLPFWAPRDACVRDPSSVQYKKIRVKCDQDSIFGQRKIELVLVNRSTAASILNRQHVDAVTSQTLACRSREMFVHVELK